MCLHVLLVFCIRHSLAYLGHVQRQQRTCHAIAGCTMAVAQRQSRKSTCITTQRFRKAPVKCAAVVVTMATSQPSVQHCAACHGPGCTMSLSCFRAQDSCGHHAGPTFPIVPSVVPDLIRFTGFKGGNYVNSARLEAALAPDTQAYCWLGRPPP